ncbi:MAG: acyl-CoA synthetase [Deltaproteobacteria bacterium]|nr:acyl-CoA synthetase [Deltaproteobacteria bacterium]
MDRVKISRLADVEEFERVPLNQRLPFTNTYDMIKHGAAMAPQSPAISFLPSGDRYTEPVKISYSELVAQITRTANLFHDLGVAPGKVISYLLPNLPQCHFVLWGGEAAGIVNPINPLLEPSTIRDICQRAGTEVLVALGEAPGSDIWDKALAIRKNLPNLRAIIRVMGPSDEKEGVYGYDEIVGGYNPDTLDSKREIDPNDTASLFHTGGTTGTPKLAPHTHFNEAAMAFMVAASNDLYTGETIMSGLPLFHVNGTTVTGSMPFTMAAHVVILGPRGYRDPAIIKNFYKIVEQCRAVTFSSVPTVLSALLDVSTEGADLSSLRYAVCGAAPLSVELFRRFEEHTGLKILEGYGLTEGTCVTSLNPPFGPRKVGSIGVRLPYHQAKVFQVDDQGRFVREAATDEIGSVCISGPNVFTGYLDDAHNRGTRPKEGWFNTGDLGRQDADGYLWLTGRKKDLIIRGGHNIDPSAIEDPLYRIPGVQMAAAVGRPDPHAGEAPVAYVEVQAGAGLTPEVILEKVKQEIGERAAIPKEIFIVDRIPLTPVGKIFKPALRWDSIKRVYEKDLEKLGDLAESITVTVNEDKVHGSVAKITIKPAPGATVETIRTKVDEILGLYTIRYRVELV